MDGIIPKDTLRTALNQGQTLSTRFWLSLAAMAQGGAFLFQNPLWLSHPSFVSLNEIFPLPYWGSAFFVIGLLGLWRVLSNKSRPNVAWVVNLLMTNLWSSAVVVRYIGTGPLSLCSVYSVCALMAAWCLIRTEATHRDTQSA